MFRIRPYPGIPILLYHKLGRPQPGSLIKGQYVSPSLFRRHLGYLARVRYQAISLSQLVEFLHSGVMPVPKPIVITFDDGYECVYQEAFPLLMERGFSATVFLVGSGIGGTNEWEQAIGDVAEPMMSRQQIREMMEHGMEFGSHTWGHRHLTRIPLGEARREIADSKAKLEDMLGAAIQFFAYPYGQYNQAIRDLVEESGYLGACSTLTGVNVAGHDPYWLLRMNVRRYNYLPRFIYKLAKLYWEIR